MSENMRRAVYPGTFDPVTLGHLDVVERGAKLFDELVVAIAANTGKVTLFDQEERLDLLTQVTAHISNVSVEAYSGLTVEFVRARGASAILRGIRTYTDFEYEFQMALMNRNFGESIETVFVLPREEYAYISSKLVKECAALGGDIGLFVPRPVSGALAAKFRK